MNCSKLHELRNGVVRPLHTRVIGDLIITWPFPGLVERAVCAFGAGTITVVRWVLWLDVALQEICDAAYSMIYDAYRALITKVFDRRLVKCLFLRHKDCVLIRQNLGAHLMLLVV